MGINEDTVLLFVILILSNAGSLRYTTFFFAVIRCSYHVSQLVEFQKQIDTWRGDYYVYWCVIRLIVSSNKFYFILVYYFRQVETSSYTSKDPDFLYEEEIACNGGGSVFIFVPVWAGFTEQCHWSKWLKRLRLVLHLGWGGVGGFCWVILLAGTPTALKWGFLWFPSVKPEQSGILR